VGEYLTHKLIKMAKGKKVDEKVLKGKGLIMPLVPILESKSQNGTQMFKNLKMVPFFVETSHVCPCR